MNNFKMRCVYDNNEAFRGIYSGDVYEVINGKFIDSNGALRPYNTTLDYLNDTETLYPRCKFELVADSELVNDSKFSIKDLKPCMLVELRKGDLCMVMENSRGLTLTTKQRDSFIINKNYNDKLKEVYFKDESYDIMKVWGFTSISRNTLDFVTENRPLLYERKEKVKMTLEEIEERLGMKIELI